MDIYIVYPYMAQFLIKLVQYTAYFSMTQCEDQTSTLD